MAAATHHGTHSWARLRICQLAEGWRVFVACHNPDAAKLRCLAQDMLNVVAMDVTDAEGMILKPNMVLPELTSPSKKRWGEYNAAMERT